MKKIKILFWLFLLSSCADFIYNPSIDSIVENAFVLTKKKTTLTWNPFSFSAEGCYTIFLTNTKITHTLIQLPSHITTYNLDEIYLTIYAGYEVFVSACVKSEDGTYQIIASTNSIFL